MLVTGQKPVLPDPSPGDQATGSPAQPRELVVWHRAGPHVKIVEIGFTGHNQ